MTQAGNTQPENQEAPMSDTREGLMALALRCERASGADRELDVKLMRVLFGSNQIDWLATAAYQFTASLDAAMMLVPEGWRVSILEEQWHTGKWKAQVAPRPTAAMIATANNGHTVGWETSDCDSAATPALALCAAALRARSTNPAILKKEGE